MLFSILLERIAIMALLMAVGVYLSRKGFLSEQGSRDLGAILLRIIIPCVIIKSYITEYSHQRLLELGLSALLALISYVVAMLLSYLVFGQRRRLENFAAAFCNAGFIGIPLVQAVVGQEGVFYIAASVALLNLFQWTYGVYIMTGRKDTISPKAIARNPVVISIHRRRAVLEPGHPARHPHQHPGVCGGYEHPCGYDPHGNLSCPAAAAAYAAARRIRFRKAYAMPAALFRAKKTG